MARILVHDFGGHPHTVQLARWLTARGHRILYLHCPDVEGPRGAVEKRPEDGSGLECRPLSIGRTFSKYAFLQRFRDETAYGLRLGRAIRSWKPEIVLSANAPPLIQALALRSAHAAGARYVNWVQDIFALAVPSVGQEAAGRRWSRLIRGPLLKLLERLEFGAMRKADALVLISPEFAPLLASRGVVHPRQAVIENWAPASEIPALPKDNEWARRHGLTGRFVFLMAGTLGLKHDTEPLAALARAFRDKPEVRLVVVSQGLGREALERVVREEALDNVQFLDFQPFRSLPQMLAAADVAVTVIRPFAAAISVPSRLLSYACAGKAVLAAVPEGNLGHRLIAGTGAGLTVEPDDIDGFVMAAHRLYDDADFRAECAAANAGFAARAFDIDVIGSRFEAVFTSLSGGR